MSDRFYSPKQKLARAHKHIEDLERECNRFREQQNWSHVAEVNPDTGRREFKIVFPDGIDFSDVSCIAADALTNLRSTLDHSCTASAMASGIVKPRSAYFPIASDLERLENKINGNCKDLHPDIKELIRRLKPYKTGNPSPSLWVLSDAANIEKHAIMGPYLPALTAIFGGPSSLDTGVLDRIIPRFNSGKNEIIYATAAPEINPRHNIQLVVDVAFAEWGFLKDQPTVFVLQLLAHEVKCVLMDIEAETRRLFPGAF